MPSRRTSQPSSSEGGANPDFARLVAWLDQHADALLDDPQSNLIGIGIGKKSAGPLTDDSSFCLTGFVERKLPERQIAERGIRPFAAAAAQAAGVPRPEELDLPIDLVETGSSFRAQIGLTAPAAQRGVYGGLPPTLDLQKRFNALRSGIGITNPHRAYPKSLSVGTLGFFVQDERGKRYLVSNNHVIADENAGKPGDAIVQPGTLDLTQNELSLMGSLAKLNAQLKIAELSAFVPIQFQNAQGIPFNSVDCAAAALSQSGRDLTGLARVGFGGDVRGVAAPLTVDPVSGLLTGPSRVYKAGRTTGWTEGEVTQINVVTDVTYQAGKARFRDQIGISASPDSDGPFSRPGDSGSAVVSRDQELVGLLFAGSEQRTLANPIQLVLNALKTALGVAQLTVVT